MTTKQKRRPKIGVVVGSGGIKCFGALELFSFFEKEKIPIDLLVGCSGGAICCCLYAQTGSVAKVKEAAVKLLRPSLFRRFNFSAFGAIAGLPGFKFKSSTAFFNANHLARSLQKQFGNLQLEDLPIKTIVQATDMNTGEEVLLDRGSVAEAIHASIAIQPYIAPVFIDERLLGDGGYTNSLPLLTAVNQKMDIIVGISFEVEAIVNTLIGMYRNLVAKTVGKSRDFQLLLATRKHHYEIITIPVKFKKHLQLWDFKKMDEINRHTRKAIAPYKEQILHAIHAFEG